MDDARGDVPVAHDGDEQGALQRSLAELEREKRVVESLYRVAQTVATHDDLHAIVQVVTDETTSITGAQFGAFFYNVVRRDGELLSLYTISGVPKERFERFPMPRATDIFRPTFEGTGNVRLDDVLADPRFGRNAPYNGMPSGHLPVRSYLAVPVFATDGSVFGGLFFGHEEPGVFTEEAERITTGIAAQAGTAIEKARLLAVERDARAEAEARSYAAASLEYVEDAIVLVDREGAVRLWNRAAATITGLRPASVLGRTLGEALPSWERIALEVPVGEQEQNVAPRTLPLDTHDGREVWISVYGVLSDEGTVYAFRDVSGERELEALRADVIATVSHELRTPVAAVYGAAQTLRRPGLPEALSQQLLEILGSEAERLTTLVDEILLTSQIDSGQVELSRDPVDPVETVRAAILSVRVGAEAGPIELEAEGPLPLVSADREKVRQVLANLIENALKYGRPGGTVTVRLEAVRGAVRFSVTDEGSGIPHHEHARIFEKFYRLDPHMKEGVRGTGLGLYISRELVQRMGGRIGLTSAEGGGSTFWFELAQQWDDGSL